MTGLPPNAIGRFEPASVTPTAGGAPSVLTIDTGGADGGSAARARGTTASGTYNLTVTATGGGITRTATVQLIVQAAGTPMFTLQASPPSQSIVAGQSTSYSVTLTSQNGFNSPVDVNVTGLPSGATAVFNPSSVTPTVQGAASTLTVQTAAATPAGSSSLTITGTGGGSTNQAPVALTVTVAGGCVPESVVGPGGLPTSGWPKAGADVRNTGRGQGSGATGQLKWVVNTGRDSAGFQVTIGPDGTIYHTTYPSNDGSPGQVVARNPADGSVKWTFTESRGGWIPTVGRNGLVYIFSGRLYALDAQTGAKRWESEPSGFSGTPTVGADGTVYVVGGGLVAYDGATGARKFVASTGGLSGWQTTTPAIGADGTLYFGGVSGGATATGGFYAIDGKNGCVRWFKDAGRLGGVAVGDDGTLYATVQPNLNSNIPPTSVIAFDPSNGNVKWTAPNVPGAASPPAIGQDGTIYVRSTANQLTALNPANGAAKWSYAPQSFGADRASPAIGADGTIYTVKNNTSDNQLIAVNPATGAVKWSYTLEAYTTGPVDATPTVAPDGTVYVTTFGLSAGKVYAVK